MKRKYEESFGIIPISGKKILLVRHKGGHWSFPKGHPEKGESPQKTAERELKEEVNLSISSFLDRDSLSESYIFKTGPYLIQKKVTYFLAHVTGDLKIQEEELTEAAWFTLSEAYQRATFPELKKIIKTLESLRL